MMMMMMMEMLALPMRCLLDTLPLGEELVFGIIVLGGVLLSFFLEGFSEDIMFLFFFSFIDTLFLYMRSCDHL